jgi:hypothetical protein
VLVTMMRFATREEPGSLAATFSMLASPKVVDLRNAPGTDQNPVVVDARMLMPRAVDQMILAPASGGDDAVFTLSAVVTREGRVSNVEWHSPSGRSPASGSREAEAMDTLLGVASLARFEPARFEGLPVAVNMVWLVANVTVRGKVPSLDLPVPVASGVPSPRKRRVDVVIPVTALRRAAVA